MNRDSIFEKPMTHDRQMQLLDWLMENYPVDKSATSEDSYPMEDEKVQTPNSMGPYGVDVPSERPTYKR